MLISIILSLYLGMGLFMAQKEFRKMEKAMTLYDQGEPLPNSDFQVMQEFGQLTKQFNLSLVVAMLYIIIMVVWFPFKVKEWSSGNN